MFLQNSSGPFVSEHFAERLALLVIEEKYRTVFSVRGPAKIVDKGGVWSVTFENAATDEGGGSIKSQVITILKSLTIEIRKSNGEIVTIA